MLKAALDILREVYGYRDSGLVRRPSSRRSFLAATVSC